MKLPAAVLLTFVAATCQVVIAQDPLVARLNATPVTTLQPPLPAAEHFVPPSLSAPPVTPELWVYSQELRRHDDPAQAVRRKAEAKADQRLARLAAMKWYGYSNSRPVASSIPTMGPYSPGWTGNGLERYDWAGVSLAPSAVFVGGWSYSR